MAQINIGSDLLETIFTEDEAWTAKQLMDKNFSIQYLQNSRVAIVRQLAMQSFNDASKDQDNHRERAYLRGQLDLLDAIISAALEPGPAPSEQISQQTLQG